MIASTEKNDHYIPGTCNIGNQEVQYRRWAVYMNVVVIVAVVVLLQVYQTPHLWRLSLFPLLGGLFVNGQQVYLHFCVRFGLSGVFNFDKVGKHHSVEQMEYARLDRIKAWRMIISSILIALALTVIYYLLPV